VDLPAPDTVEGRSLAPVVRGEAEAARDSLFFAYTDVQRAVRDRRFKLIEYAAGDGRVTQLFDLEADPWETANLACAPEMEPELVRLRCELAAWQRRVDDPMAGEFEA